LTTEAWPFDQPRQRVLEGVDLLSPTVTRTSCDQQCCLFGFRSESSTLLVGGSPGQPGAALRQPRRGPRTTEEPRHRPPTDAAAAGEDLIATSHRIRAGHSPRGPIVMVRNVSVLATRIFGRGDKTRAEEAQAHPPRRPVCPGSRAVCASFPLPDAAASAFHSPPVSSAQLSSSGESQISLHLVLETSVCRAGGSLSHNGPQPLVRVTGLSHGSTRPCDNGSHVTGPTQAGTDLNRRIEVAGRPGPRLGHRLVTSHDSESP
jgi:hypothetical protein